MDIGSAKIRPEEMEGVPHYLVDVLERKKTSMWSVFSRWRKQRQRRFMRGAGSPIAAGGTGFYIQALLYDIDFTENDGDSSFRRKLEKTAEEKGGEYLHSLLQEADPEAALQIHPHNIKPYDPRSGISSSDRWKDFRT